MQDNIVFQIPLTIPYEKAVEKVTAALKEEGFGVLTEIDVKATMKKKLDKDFRPYIILGACNPPLAYKALSNEPMIGGLLPCNVTVEATNEGSLVQIVNPAMMIGAPPLSDNPALREVAEEASARLQRVSEIIQM
jgi:uncharacterized protein (DUF302 family)